MAVIRLRLTGEPGNQRRPQTAVRYLRTDFADHFLQILPCRVASHAPQHIIRRVLNRHVQIMQHLGLCCNRVDQLVRDLLRIAVQQPDPADPVDGSEAAQQRRKPLLPIKIRSVKRCLLCNQDQFLHPALCQFLRLRQHLLHRNGAVRSADARNHAVCAPFVAALGNPQVPIMASCREDARLPAGRRFVQRFRENFMSLLPEDVVCGFDNSVNRGRAEDNIHLRHFLFDIVTVSLCETAGHNKSLEQAALLPVCHLKNCLDTLCLCVLNKTAGIDHCNICCLYISCETVSM